MKQDNETNDFILNLIKDYVKIARSELNERWLLWKIDFQKEEVHETIGALLARQVTLATQIAKLPKIWNNHIAPVLLRAMADVYISLAWILEDPLERSRKFILFGLGQNKLEIEYRKKNMGNLDETSKDLQKQIIEALENWGNSQRYLFLTEANLGSWSNISTREMAMEANCIDFYNYVYVPFSSAAHSMWNHVSCYNLQTCTNPLHGYHKVPIDPDLEIDILYFYLAAEYLQKTFNIFDSKVNILLKKESAFEYLEKQIKILKHK